MAFVLLIPLSAFAQESNIPTWIKNNAGWWADDAIDDSSYAQGIQFLMKEGLLKPTTLPDEFPSYLKTDAKNWSDGTISDKEYLLKLESWIDSNNQELIEKIPSSSSSYVESTETIQNQITNNKNIEIGIKIGQWTKYRLLIESGGFGDMENFAKLLEQKLKEQFQDESGLSPDNVIWIKYTVADISGTIVTFDRSAKLATSSEMRDEFKHQSFRELLDPENKVDDDVLANVYEKKLESKQFDLANFEPGFSFVMPTNLEFGSKFAGAPAYGEITFASIEDVFRSGTKENLFTANKINTQTFRNGVVETTVEIDTLYDVYYDRLTGFLNSRSTYMDFMNMNTYDTAWITIEIAKIDSSDNLKPTSGLKPINDKNDILERLSYLFVESANSRYLLANMVESIGEPKKTTFDIINTRDGSELGAFILYGNDKISSITSSTVFTGLQEMNNADDIHIMIRQSLVPNCCAGLPTHSTLLMDNIDGDQNLTKRLHENI
jgi:hypothetical protein